MAVFFKLNKGDDNYVWWFSSHLDDGEIHRVEDEIVLSFSLSEPDFVFILFVFLCLIPCRGDPQERRCNIVLSFSPL